MLTAKQYETLQFIRRYMSQHGYAPTESEIAAGIGIKSRGVVHRYVCALEQANMLERIPNRRRNIRLLSFEKTKSPTHFRLPILGKIAAGSPLEAIRDEDPKELDLMTSLWGANRFLLKVNGNSMIGDHIQDGDHIICEKNVKARPGDIVIALIDNQDVTLKRFQCYENGTIALVPSNPAMSTMIYPPERVTIQGVFVGLLRLATYRYTE